MNKKDETEAQVAVRFNQKNKETLLLHEKETCENSMLLVLEKWTVRNNIPSWHLPAQI